MARLEDPTLNAIEADLACCSVIDEAVRIVAARVRNSDDLRELALIRQCMTRIKQRAQERRAHYSETYA